jgi:hypothetical protein
MPGSNSGSSSSSSSSSNSGKTTAKNKKAAAKKKLEERRANATSVRNNVTAKYGKGKLGRETRAKIEAKLKKIRGDAALDTAEREAKEKKLWKDVARKLKELEEAEAAKKAAEEAEKAAKKEAAKSARTAATTARREQKERDLAKAKANLKEFLGKSPLKKNVNALYKERKNKPGLTAKNYGRARGLRNATRKLSNSAEKLLKKYKSIAADFEAKGVDGGEFCDMADRYRQTGEWLQTKHKDAGLKHSIPTIIQVCARESEFANEGAASE